MKTRAIVGLVAGLSILAASLAHGLLGWSQFAGPLSDASLDPGIVGGLSVGWHYGSFMMAAAGLVVSTAALASLRRGTPPGFASVIVGAATLVFGLWAFVTRELNTHFLLFIAQGFLVLSYSRTGR